MDSRYLTVDLLLESESELTELVIYLEGKVLFLYNETTHGLSKVGFESNLINTSGPDVDITELLNLIDIAPSNVKNIWNNCKSKVIDVGYESGNTQNTIDSCICIETLRLIVKYGCSINVRIYPYVGRPENEKEIIFVNEE